MSSGPGARRAAIAIGTNLGNRRAALEFATTRLRAILTGLVVSDAVETEPEGEGLEGQPLYLNAVAVGESTLDARELLDAL
ncbi:MAG: 2-amino-4-hydroxy-6-hydroxymethyldihydropteridine diphosphokinase, partial [Acidobacteria bacterium]|nr:2-amino-4-hydroxy-6-hydroxymethyldihydropteridine diphosphokinase [Acidobacteriota bacterium]